MFFFSPLALHKFESRAASTVDTFRDMIRLRVLCLVFCAILVSSLKGVSLNKIYNASLTGDNSITLHWKVNYAINDLDFEIHLPSSFGWFAFGFSDRGKLFPADYCLLWQNQHRKWVMEDTYTDEKGVLHLDKQQDCKGFRSTIKGGVLKFTFSRQFDTCDRRDYIIDDGTTHIVWARGNHRLYVPEGLNISSPPEDQGMIRVHLLKNTKANTGLPSNVMVLDILTQNVSVPSHETTYWCRVIKLPNAYRSKHHIYQYESRIEDSSAGLVHHMEVFHCKADPREEIPIYDGDCFSTERPEKTQVCKRVLAAWAMGAPPFTYPLDAGLPIGGKDFNQYVMLEVHYNNPGHIEGKVDNSGIRFYVSKSLRKYDAGVIELGLEYTDKMAIPPGQELFPLTGYCTSSCTAVGLPKDGITIFGSQLHTHLTGVRVYTRHFDEYGTELPELNRDNHFSTHFQEIRRLKEPVKVLPGHVLITRCDYNTEDRKEITLGGFGIADEMCVNYVHYYPHTDLEVCKSAISDQALKTYFNYMNEWEGQPTSPELGISDNYKAIHWNRIRTQLLNEMYNEAPLSMQCNMSTGDRFPGYWENAHIPPIIHPLAPPKRQCLEISGYE